MTSSLARRLGAEALGTGLLVATVVGSGIMAERLTGDAALALLCNAVATGAILTVLISILAPISGAHFNPVVTLVMALRRSVSWVEAGGYAAVQLAGACAGTIVAHLMFAVSALEMGTRVRTGTGQWLAEGVATFGLVLTILLAGANRLPSLPALVGGYILSAYWFTSSTSFANPAVTLARMLTITFSGIRSDDVPAFIAAQVAGALLAAWLCRWLLTGADRA